MFDSMKFFQTSNNGEFNRPEDLDKLREAEKNVWILGANKLAESLASILSASGFVDDVNVDLATLGGLEVIRSSALPHDSIVVSAVTQARPQTAVRSIRAQGLVCIDFFSLMRSRSEEIAQIPYWLEADKDFLQNADSYAAVRRGLKDAESTKVFDDVMKFKLSHDLSHMVGHSYRIEEQYLEDFLEFESIRTVFDIGAFRGESSIAMASKKTPQEFFLFEPSAENAQFAESNCEIAGLVSTVSNVALSDTSMELTLSGAGPSASVADGGEGERISAERLDSLDLPSPDLIKLDIEGHEMAALRGAQVTLESHRPKVAVAVYHRPQDLREIFSYLSDILGDSDIYLRHYTEGYVETVLYFVPR